MTFEMESRVRWYDTDESGRINFASMFEHFQDAEREYLREKGLAFEEIFKFGDHPCVHTECDFMQPLHFDDVIKIQVSSEVGKKSITYNFKVFKNEDLVAEGKTVDVFVKNGKSTKLPEKVREVLG